MPPTTLPKLSSFLFQQQQQQPSATPASYSPPMSQSTLMTAASAFSSTVRPMISQQEHEQHGSASASRSTITEQRFFEALRISRSPPGATATSSDSLATDVVKAQQPRRISRKRKVQRTAQFSHSLPSLAAVSSAQFSFVAGNASVEDEKREHHAFRSRSTPSPASSDATADASTGTDSVSSTSTSTGTSEMKDGSQSSTVPRERTSRYLSEGDRREIIQRIEAGEKQVALAKEYQVSRAAICNLYKNRREVLIRVDRDPEAKHPKKQRPSGASVSTSASVSLTTAPAASVPGAESAESPSALASTSVRKYESPSSSPSQSVSPAVPSHVRADVSIDKNGVFVEDVNGTTGTQSAHMSPVGTPVTSPAGIKRKRKDARKADHRDDATTAADMRMEAPEHSRPHYRHHQDRHAHQHHQHHQDHQYQQQQQRMIQHSHSHSQLQSYLDRATTSQPGVPSELLSRSPTEPVPCTMSVRSDPGDLRAPFSVRSERYHRPSTQSAQSASSLQYQYRHQQVADFHHEHHQQHQFSYHQQQHPQCQYSQSRFLTPHTTTTTVTSTASKIARPFTVHDASAYSLPIKQLLHSLYAAMGTRGASSGFRHQADRVMRLLVEETLSRVVQHETESAVAATGAVTSTTFALPLPLNERDVCAVSIESERGQGGAVLLRAFANVQPLSPTGVITLSRVNSSPGSSLSTTDRRGPRPSLSADHNDPWRVDARLPTLRRGQAVLVLDVQCTTGERARRALHHLVHELHVPPSSIYFVTLNGAVPGLRRVHQYFPEVSLVTAQMGDTANEQEGPPSGVSDFLDRYWNPSAADAWSM